MTDSSKYGQRITEVSDNTTNGHTIKQGAHACRKSGTRMHLCFCLPAKQISFLTSSPIISRSCETFLTSQTNFPPGCPNFRAANISEQSNQSAQPPQFWAAEIFGNNETIFTTEKVELQPENL